jgi:hypothetical protein
MDATIRTHLNNLWSEDRALQNQTFSAILAATDEPVDRAYEVWDEQLAGLTHKDNHVRSIAAQVLCTRARSESGKNYLVGCAAPPHTQQSNISERC